MKLPINFNDSYPLTLGVADDYFTLSTRLKRLARAPMQPRRRAAWLLSGALLLSFGAVVPIELTARAQSEAKIALSGIVKDASGNAVDGATVYLALRNRAEPLETTNSDKDGRYEFSSEIGENRSFVVWADAGARGLGQSYLSRDKGGARIANPVVVQSAPVKLLLVAPDGTRAANLRVRVGQMGPEIDEQWIVPRPLAQRLQTQTNARGEAVFAALPVGQIAQFWLSDQKYYQTPIGFGDLRGGQYAPLSADESVKVGKQKGWKTIRLLAPVTLRGNVSSRVSTPIGIGKSGALVTAIRFSVWKAEEFSVPMTPQARTDAQGDYVMAGLRPGSYRVQVESEPWLARSSVSPVETRELKAPSGRVDLALSGGGLIRGVMRVKGTTTPAVGQNVGVIDAKRNYQVTKTDARGAFEFRANTGTALVLTPNGSGDGNGQLFARFVSGQFSFENAEMKNYGDTPSGFRVMSETRWKKMIIAPVAPRNDRSAKYDFTISGSQLAQVPVKAGATRQITLEMPAENLVKAATLSGQVSRPDGTGARATIMVRPAADIDYRNAIEKPTDARGRYSIAGLKPGRYKISAQLDGEISANWVAPKLTQTLVTGANRADIKLSRGAVITGVVWAKSNHHVIAGVEVLTADEDGDGTIDTTRSNGVFRFRVAPGRVAVRLHQSSTPPPGFKLTRQELFFDAKDGGGMHTTFELPAASATTKAATAIQAITGVVVGPDGQPVAGAVIAIRDVSSARYISWRGSATSDASGRFTIPPKLINKGVSLWASSADKTLATPRALVATAGDEVTLKLERDVAAAVEGQIVDKISKKPIAGVTVLCHSPVTGSPQELMEQQTDAQGRFRFERLRPFEVSFLQVAKRGYQEDGTQTFVLQKGENKQFEIWMHPLNQTLSGRVLRADGKSAGAGLVMYASNQRTRTRADGTFKFPAVLDEKFQVTIASRAQKKSWGPFWTRGGRDGVTFQLTDARLDTRNYNKSQAQAAALRASRVKLVGTPAPPLRVARWIVGAAPSFKGKTTLLYFVSQNQHSSALNDLARSFRGRGVQVVSIEQLRPYWEFDVPANREQYLIDRARDMGTVHPVAIDAPLAKPEDLVSMTGQSHKFYRDARYVIVGRDGIIKWVGGDGGQAIAKTIVFAR